MRQIPWRIFWVLVLITPIATAQESTRAAEESIETQQLEELVEPPTAEEQEAEERVSRDPSPLFQPLFQAPEASTVEAPAASANMMCFPPLIPPPSCVCGSCCECFICWQGGVPRRGCGI